MSPRLASWMLAATLLAAVPAAPQTDKAAGRPPLRKDYIRLKYAHANEIGQAIRVYIDPAQGEMVSWTGDQKLITISALPETMDRVLKAVKELDVKPADTLITVQLVLGREGDARTDPGLQSDPIVRDLAKLLRYKSYTLLDTAFVRATDGNTSEVVIGPKAEFVFNVRPRVVKDGPVETILLEVLLRQDAWDDSTPNVRQKVVKDLIQSNLSLRSGDKTVVGVSKLDGGDTGLILIIAGKVV